jgi:hypothetical protein
MCYDCRAHYILEKLYKIYLIKPIKSLSEAAILVIRKKLKLREDRKITSYHITKQLGLILGF